MSYGEELEGIGVSQCQLSDFFIDLKGQLALLTGLIKIPDDLSLEDIRRPLLVIGKPGIGKTCGIVSIINELNEQLPAGKQLKMKKILLGQTVVGTLSGLPLINQATSDVIRVQAPELPTVEKDGEYGVLFLDEITTADEAQIQPALGLADDTRCMGLYTLPEHWIVVGAGNGPDCANFIKLDDMTLTRFTAYDISYDYKKDWRPWAHANGIESIIIAYLNFNPSAIVDVIATEMDKSGKMFACPRTWTRLSSELKIRTAQGRQVSQSELYKFASRIIGEKTAREFSAFAAFKSKVHFSAEKILAGTESLPEEIIEIEAFHILMQSITTELTRILKLTSDENGDFPQETYTNVANMMDWVLHLQNYMLENVVNAIAEFRNEVPNVLPILGDDDFLAFCPAFDEFLELHGEALMNTDLDSLI